MPQRLGGVLLARLGDESAYRFSLRTGLCEHGCSQCGACRLVAEGEKYTVEDGVVYSTKFITDTNEKRTRLNIADYLCDTVLIDNACICF